MAVIGLGMRADSVELMNVSVW